MDKAMLFNGSQNAAWTLVLAHGAGQGMDSPFMNAFAEGLAARGELLGGLRVARFEFPYMAARRNSGKQSPPDRESVLLACWCEAVGALEQAGCERARLAIGGKSLGGRMASLIADGQRVAGLLCLGYPFHPPGKPEKLRTNHLIGLKTPTLICQGERDPFGRREEVESYELSGAISLYWLSDGDHGFKPRKASGLSEADNWESAMTAIIRFIGALR